MQSITTLETTEYNVPEVPPRPVRVCNKCFIEKDISLFANDARCKSNRKKTCIECNKPPESRQCTKCKEDKPLTAFGEDPRYKHGRKSICLECYNQYRKDYTEKHKPPPEVILEKLQTKTIAKLEDNIREMLRMADKADINHEMLVDMIRNISLGEDDAEEVN